MKKKTIGVLMGGASIEKEVSFNTGRTLCDHMDTEKYNSVPFFLTADGKLYKLPWRFMYRGKISDFEHRLETDAKKIKWDDLRHEIDLMYIALHGRYGEDGCVQGFLELLGIPYYGAGILGSALGMDKIMQKEWLSLNGITVPRGIHLTPQQVHFYETNKPAFLTLLAHQNVVFPVVVKPQKEGSSLGIAAVFDEQELMPAIIAACQIGGSFEQSVLIEERIEGMEFTCTLLFDQDGKPVFLPPTEILYESGYFIHGYEQKYMPGRSIKFTPARCSSKDTVAIQETCLKVATVLDFKFMARVDGFLKKDGTVVIIDPNTFSGMAPSSFIFNQAAEIGMNHRDLIDYLLDTAINVAERCLHA